MAEPSFPTTELVSLYDGGYAAEALDRFRRQEFALAEVAIDMARSEKPSQAQLEALDILEARVQRDSGHWKAAAMLFAASAKTNSDIRDYLHYQAARAFAKAGDAEATVHAKLVSSQSPWGAEIEFLLAEAARASGEMLEAESRFRAFLESSEDQTLRSEARFRLGEVFHAQGKEAEAKASWRGVLMSDPTSPWASQLRSKDASLEAHPSPSELVVRGMAYFNAMRNLESAADLKKALASKALDLEARCQAQFHRAKSMYKEREYRRAAPLFVPAIDTCKASENRNYEVKSAYQAGLAYSRAGDHSRSAHYFQYVERYPDHSYADDARLRRAEQYDAMQNDSKVRELLSSLPTLYPKGDMRTEALWRLARSAYMRKDYAAAVTWLAKQIRIVPIETHWWAEGQAPYWLGRSLARMGESEKAVSAYRECIRLYPLTYYSLQAFARLKEGWPDAYAAAIQEVRSQPSAWTEELRPRAVYQSAGFRSALHLARLGIGDATRRQLDAVGMSVPQGRDAVTSVDAIDALVATSRVLDLAGDYEHSHWIGRWHAIDYRRSWPNGASRLRWRLAYPLAYWNLLQDFAKRYSYPPNLQMAIVREESAFDPSRESWANAIGLTQMIFPTAHDHSKGTGIAVTRENLKHPVKNVTIGSHFLNSLQEAFEGRVGLMVPGYNAGRARVRGWIRQRHRYDLDEFIELIPGDQARRYSKRVLGSYFTYSYLHDGQVPEIRNAVPRRLGHL